MQSNFLVKIFIPNKKEYIGCYLYLFMARIKDIVENIKTKSKKKEVSAQSFVEEIKTFLDIIQNLDKASMDNFLDELKNYITELSPLKAALLSVACGALVEHRADPLIALDPILEKVNTFLSLSLEFIKAFQEETKAHPGNPQSIYNSVSERMPLEAEAWNALDQIYPSVIAMLSKSKEARKRVKLNEKLITLADLLYEKHRAAKWLFKISSILDDEEMLVLYPAMELGYRIKISGISSNHQLHLLLAGTLIGNEKKGWISGTPPDPKLVSYVRDVFYTGNARAESYFQMHNWRGLKPNGTLVKQFEKYNDVRFDYYLIWGGEPPINIPKFNGIRIILLSDPSSGAISLTNNFNARREFPFMDAELTVLEKLPLPQVRELLDKIKKTNKANEGKPFVSKEHQDADLARVKKDF